MTTPGTPAAGAPSGVPWYARPRVVLPVLLVLVLASALLARERVSGRAGDPRLSAYSAQPMGARLLYETANRLGWNVVRTRGNPLPQSDASILAVLDPIDVIRPAEAHAILEFVRAGGGLLLALGERTGALSDSLQVAPSKTSGVVDSQAERDACAVPGRFSRNGLWIGSATLIPLIGRGLDVVRSDTLLQVRVRSRTDGAGRFQPAIVAMPYERGRIVVAADPDVFRNDALRECRYGLDVPAIRALEYLREGAGVRRSTLVFDEFHQGSAKRAGMSAAVQRYLAETRSGHAVLQISIAGIVLLLAMVPRLLVPRDTSRVERRSPLEHVDALARAYEQVRASRTATTHLVRGLRRRVERGRARARAMESDEMFLGRVAETTPSLAADVTIVRNALNASLGQRDFESVGVAIARIEEKLTSP